MTTTRPAAFSLRSIAVPAFGPALLFSIGEGAILPVVALSARDLGASVAVAALIVTLIGLGSWFFNLPASLITLKFGERWAIVGAAAASAVALAQPPSPRWCRTGSGCWPRRWWWSAWPPACSAWPGRNT